MRQLNVSTLVSLDGVIQDPGGFGETEQGGWAGPYFDAEAVQYSLDHLLASDFFLCGRVTYELMARAWSQINEGAYNQRMNAIPKLVASTTLDGPLEWNATAIKGNLVEEIARLKREDGQDILMYGSAGLMRTLIQHDLIDEYQIWVHPVVLGAGKRLFGDEVAADLRLVGTKTLGSGVVILTYEPARRTR